MSGQEKKLNASQRLEKLEVNVQELLMYMNNMARDVQILKEAMKLLGNKADAIQKGANVSDDTVAAGMIANNVQDLREKVESFKAQGILQVAEVSDSSSFLVGKEVDDDGAVKNQRVQFAVSTLNQELQEKLVGKKVGDTVEFSEGTLKLVIDEVYAITTPQQRADVEA